MKTLIAAYLITLVSLPVQAGDIAGRVDLVSKPGPRARAKEVNFRGRDTRYANLHGGYTGGGPDLNAGPSEPELEKQEGLESVVLELVDPQGHLATTPWSKENGRNRMEQKDKNFLPHVVIVPQGSRVFFFNDDPFPHHIYSVSQDPKGFEIPEHTREKGRHPVLFAKAGILELFCGLHPRMNAYVYVSHSDFAVRPDASHQYRLAHVPAGKYRLRVWHPRYKEKFLDVTVPEQGTVKLDISL